MAGADRRGPQRHRTNVGVRDQTHPGIAAPDGRVPPAPCSQHTGHVKLQVTSTRHLFSMTWVRATTARVESGGYVSRTRFHANFSRLLAKQPRPFCGTSWNMRTLHLHMSGTFCSHTRTYCLRHPRRYVCRHHQYQWRGRGHCDGRLQRGRDCEPGFLALSVLITMACGATRSPPCRQHSRPLDR